MCFERQSFVGGIDMDEYIRVETDLGPCVLEVGCPAPYGFAPSSCDDGATLVE